MDWLFDWWYCVGSDKGTVSALLRVVVFAGLLLLAYECVTIHFRWQNQAVLGLTMAVLAYLVHRASRSENVTLLLTFASLLATGRYAYWRITNTAEIIAAQGRTLGYISIFFIFLFLLAECYAFLVMVLGYVQVIEPLHRQPLPMPEDRSEWPHIDLLIPTYNEPLSIVRTTIFGAINLDYPAEKLHIYVLDDGRREEFRLFCAARGIGYVTRSDNDHAKAGNINHALGRMTSPYVAIFDCDHVPARNFLQMTVGWFLRDKRLGILQTPHFFYTADPFERNLRQFTKVPNEGEWFYGCIQDGNDFWNATFFCGSCSVLNRCALDEIGGIAVETVTEDAHTSLRMQSRGWNTAYINQRLSAGLATESLSAHIGQRVRWARGMTQILRIDNPLFAKGLKWPQRLCYLNSVIYYLYAGPRLVFFTAPLVYMLLGFTNIPGSWIAILCYAFPHLFLANLTNYRVQNAHRHSFWSDIYELALAPYILGPTLLALINPKLGKFNVTAKGGLVREGYFDRAIARPYVALIVLNVLALALAPVRAFYWNPGHMGTILMNVAWILFDLILIGTVNAVAFESKQLRSSARINIQVPVRVLLPDGRTRYGKSRNISLGGAALVMEEVPTEVESGTTVEVAYAQHHSEVVLSARIVGMNKASLRIQHEPLTIEKEESLTLLLYSNADTWSSQTEGQVRDRPMKTFLHMVGLGLRGIGYVLVADRASYEARKKNKIVQTGAKAAGIFLLVGLLGMSGYLRVSAQTPRTVASPAVSSPDNARGSFHTVFSLKDIGVANGIVFRGVDAQRNLPFSLPQTQIASQATLHLNYAFSTGLIAHLSHMSVFLNGTLLATLPVPPNAGEMVQGLSATIPLPANLLVRDNVLTIQFVGHYTQQYEIPSSSILWGRVENTSTIDVSGTLLPLSNDLKILPLPFYDGAVSNQSATVPFAFASARPDANQLTAAGVVASWFGVQAKSRPLSFPVTMGAILPKGNVVLFIDRSSPLLVSLQVDVQGPTVAMRVNPNDPYGQILVVAGGTSDEVLTAARGLALGNSFLQGSTAHLYKVKLPALRQADDAPTWMRTDSISPFWSYSNQAELQTDGSEPVAVYLRIPPDLYYAEQNGLNLHVDYRYNPMSIANGSTLRVNANGAMTSELPLPHADMLRNNLSSDFTVPLVQLRPFSNAFLFNFYFQVAKKENGEDAPPINLQGAILRSSYLDLRGMYHWAAMPDLELFSNAGFPFTRFADLSQTKVILPIAPTPSETAMYLSLMGYFGEQTGFPSLRVETGDASLLGGDADYLVLGTAGDQPAFQKMRDRLPVKVWNGDFSVSGSDGLFSSVRHAWWQIAEMRPNWWRNPSGGDDTRGLLGSLGEVPAALLQGIESPWHENRSVIAINVRDDDAADQFTSDFWTASASSDVSQSVSVLHGDRFSSYTLDGHIYHVGHLPWWARFRYWLHEFPWLIVAITFVIALVIVPWIKVWLHRHARERLEV